MGPTAGSDIFGWREGGFGWGREGRTDLGFRGGKGKSSPLGAGVVGGRMVVMAVLIEQRVDLRRKFHLLQTVLKTFVFLIVI